MFDADVMQSHSKQSISWREETIFSLILATLPTVKHTTEASW